MTTIYEYNSPPIKAAAWTFEIVLYDSNGAIVKTPTLAVGDFKLSKDGGATANITTLPAEIGTSGVLTVSVSAAEHNADRLCLICEDQAGAQWQSAVFEWRTVAAATVSSLTAADVTLAAWGNDDGVRALTQTAAQVASVMSGSTITITRGDTLSAALTGLGSNTGYVSIDFTVKYDKADSDNDAILRIRKNASATSDGLLRLNGAALVAPVVATDGSITVNSATALTIALAARATDDLLAVDGCYFDIQLVFATTVQTITEGVCNISADVTRAIS